MSDCPDPRNLSFEDQEEQTSAITLQDIDLPDSQGDGYQVEPALVFPGQAAAEASDHTENATSQVIPDPASATASAAQEGDPILDKFFPFPVPPPDTDQQAAPGHDLPGPSHTPPQQLTYLELREQNIKEREEYFKSLNIDEDKQALKTPSTLPRKKGKAVRKTLHLDNVSPPSLRQRPVTASSKAAQNPRTSSSSPVADPPGADKGTPPAKPRYNVEDPFGDGLSVDELVVREQANVLQNKGYLPAWADFCNSVGQDNTNAILAGSLPKSAVDDLIADYLKNRVNKRVRDQVIISCICPLKSDKF